MKKLTYFLTILLGIALCNTTVVNGQNSLFGENGERTDWWVHSRFGMFIHWGLYSAAEGIWKGERHRHHNNYAEWIKYRNKISSEEYTTLAQQFDWDEIDPENWVLLAKKAGMKYITITAKHHDGFALWPTKTGDYGFGHYGSPNRDLIADLAASCRKHGIKLGFYYSHWVDWEHPFGWDHGRELRKDLTDAQFDTYWQEKVMPQLRELLTDYGDVALLWFDMWVPHQETIVKESQLRQVIHLVRELQPNCLINSRLGLPVTDPDIDYETLGDNQLGAVYYDHPWQTPGTIAHSWGYNALENQWKSTSQLLQALINNVSLNGNFMLNIGPRADGSVPYESVSRLEDMGNWMAVNGSAIYGASGLDLRSEQHQWGKITYKSKGDGKKSVFLHVFNWPLDQKLNITGITNAPQRAYLLADKSEQSLDFGLEGPYLTVKVPRMAPDHFVSVIVLEYEGEVELEKTVAPIQASGAYALNSTNVLEGNFEKVAFDGTSPEHLKIAGNGKLNWKVYVPRPMTMDVEVSYSQGGKNPLPLTVTAAEGSIKAGLAPTARVVVEPNQSYYADEFIDQKIGKVTFPQAGYYEVQVQADPGKNQTLKFNRLWLSPGNGE